MSKHEPSLADILADLLGKHHDKILDEILKVGQTTEGEVENLGGRLDAIVVAMAKLSDAVSALPTLDQIKAILGIPGAPAALVVTVELPTAKEKDMAVHKASVDLQILENGTVKYTATPVDKNGATTTLPAGTPPLTWASSDPDLTLAPDPADTSSFNLSQIGTAGNVAAAGIVATCSTTLAGAAAPITGAAAPVDVVPAPPGAPVAFVVAEA